MQCLKCGREFSDKREICIYCGASLDGQTLSQTNYIVNKESKIFITDEQNKEVKFKDLPEHVRHKIRDAIRNGDDEVIVKEERMIVQPPSAGANEERGALSLEKVITLLSMMRDSFNNNHIENSVYERMVSDIIKDYISALDDSIKLNFVMNEIIDSELSDYLNDEILNDLRAFVISSVSDKKRL